MTSPITSSSLFITIYGSLATKSNSIFTFAQFGHVWFLVTKSTINGIATAYSIKKITSLAKNFGRRFGNEIHAAPVVVLTCGPKQEYYLRIHICQYIFFAFMLNANVDNNWS